MVHLYQPVRASKLHVHLELRVRACILSACLKDGQRKEGSRGREKEEDISIAAWQTMDSHGMQQ